MNENDDKNASHGSSPKLATNRYLLLPTHFSIGCIEERESIKRKERRRIQCYDDYETCKYGKGVYVPCVRQFGRSLVWFPLNNDEVTTFYLLLYSIVKPAMLIAVIIICAYAR